MRSATKTKSDAGIIPMKAERIGMLIWLVRLGILALIAWGWITK